ncbi:hypothetical protein E5358_06745 [Palleniella muris]|uniref:Uncharacterized protein n=1 Tax=Palleniella muris TaxID=3038145 RepID=A0AC61QQH9_9BACT|nr:hypothetical protein [Palleniella muris]TGX82463.1 hypothetical protein E5358_06745 [Palleniella muris]
MINRAWENSGFFKNEDNVHPDSYSKQESLFSVVKRYCAGDVIKTIFSLFPTQPALYKKKTKWYPNPQFWHANYCFFTKKPYTLIFQVLDGKTIHTKKTQLLFSSKQSMQLCKAKGRAIF